MENFEFLTTINGIYNVGTEAKDANVFSHLEVYFNEFDETIKIKYTEINYDYLANVYNDGLFATRDEYLLNLGEIINSSYIIENINEKRIKELIFADFNNRLHRQYSYDKVF